MKIAPATSEINFTKVTEKLCELLLEVACVGAPHRSDARRRVHALTGAWEYMTEPQRAIAWERIKHLETKWGSLLPGDTENQHEASEIALEKMIAQWLYRRKLPERLLQLIHRAVNFMSEGETSLSRIMDKAYQQETDMVLTPVSMDSFREWITVLRIARQKQGEKAGQYELTPGAQRWLGKEFYGKQGLYAASLKQLVKLQAQKQKQAQTRRRKANAAWRAKQKKQKSQIA